MNNTIIINTCLKEFQDQNELNNLKEDSIFESNIRHYQGDEVDVNKKISQTLKNDLSRDFWWLNNGITIISEKCNPAPKVLFLDNVQIVNGLQTSYTLSKYYDRTNLNDNRSILVKVIMTEDKETIDKIISASNSQNYISPTLLRATDGIQRNIETYFLSKGYYYDRRKNYYKNQNKPASKIFNIQFTAQAIEAILNQSPHSARSKPTTLIKDERTYESIFDEKGNFDAYLNCCILYKKVNDYIKNEMPLHEKRIARNFSYHIARTIGTVITQKPHVKNKDLANINIDEIDNNKIQKAYEIVINTIIQYEKIYPNENIINMAKSKRFASQLNEEIYKVYIR